MGFIKREIEIIGTRKSKRVTALFDSGAYRNYVRDVFRDGEKVEDLGFFTFEGIRRTILADETIKEGFKVRFKSLKIENSICNTPEVVVMDNLIEDAIIGASLMQKLGMTLFMNERKIKVKHESI